MTVAQKADKSPDSERGGAEATSRVIQSYEEVLAKVPAELQPTKASDWTAVQREKVNAVLQEALVDSQVRGKFTLTVSNVADWEGLTVHGEFPNELGYKIRVFGKFSDDWKEKLATVNRGETVTIEGALKSTTFRDLWGKLPYPLRSRSAP